MRAGAVALIEIRGSVLQFNDLRLRRCAHNGNRCSLRYWVEGNVRPGQQPLRSYSRVCRGVNLWTALQGATQQTLPGEQFASTVQLM